MKLKTAMPKVCEDCGGDFVAGKYARFCPIHRPLHRQSKRYKYVLDGETIAMLRERYDIRVRGRALEIARQLGWPRWAVNHAAIKLGLAWSGNRKAWTAKDRVFINQWAGLRNAHWIAKKLKRSESSVVNEMKRMKIRRLVVAGYNTREVSLCFGVGPYVVDRWIKRGWMRPTLAGSDRSRPWSRFSDDQLRQFIRSHPMEFRLDKVDQVWFLGLVFGVPIDDEPDGRCGQPTAGKEIFDAAENVKILNDALDNCEREIDRLLAADGNNADLHECGAG